MTRCESISEELKAYLDGEVPLDRRVAIRLHLARCATCREEITAMESISRDLIADESNGFDAALRERLVAAAPTVPDTCGEFSRASLWQTRGFEICAAAAITAVVVIVLIPVFAQSRERSRESAAMPAAP